MTLRKLKKQKQWQTEKNQFKKINEYTYDFRNFQTMHTFGREIYNGKIALKEADKDQSSLLVEIINFKKKSKPAKSKESKRKKICLKTYIPFLRVEKEFLMLLIAKYVQ